MTTSDHRHSSKHRDNSTGRHTNENNQTHEPEIDSGMKDGCSSFLNVLFDRIIGIGNSVE